MIFSSFPIHIIVSVLFICSLFLFTHQQQYIQNTIITGEFAQNITEPLIFTNVTFENAQVQISGGSVTISDCNIYNSQFSFNSIAFLPQTTESLTITNSFFTSSTSPVTLQIFPGFTYITIQSNTLNLEGSTADIYNFTSSNPQPCVFSILIGAVPIQSMVVTGNQHTFNETMISFLCLESIMMAPGYGGSISNLQIQTNLFTQNTVNAYSPVLQPPPQTQTDILFADQDQYTMYLGQSLILLNLTQIDIGSLTIIGNIFIQFAEAPLPFSSSESFDSFASNLYPVTSSILYYQFDSFMHLFGYNDLQQLTITGNGVSLLQEGEGDVNGIPVNIRVGLMFSTGTVPPNNTVQLATLQNLINALGMTNIVPHFQYVPQAIQIQNPQLFVFTNDVEIQPNFQEDPNLAFLPQCNYVCRGNCSTCIFTSPSTLLEWSQARDTYCYGVTRFTRFSLATHSCPHQYLLVTAPYTITEIFVIASRNFYTGELIIQIRQEPPSVGTSYLFGAISATMPSNVYYQLIYTYQFSLGYNPGNPFFGSGLAMGNRIILLAQDSFNESPNGTTTFIPFSNRITTNAITIDGFYLTLNGPTSGYVVSGGMSIPVEPEDYQISFFTMVVMWVTGNGYLNITSPPLTPLQLLSFKNCIFIGAVVRYGFTRIIDPIFYAYPQSIHFLQFGDAYFVFSSIETISFENIYSNYISIAGADETIAIEGPIPVTNVIINNYVMVSGPGFGLWSINGGNINVSNSQCWMCFGGLYASGVTGNEIASIVNNTIQLNTAFATENPNYSVFYFLNNYLMAYMFANFLTLEMENNTALNSPSVPISILDTTSLQFGVMTIFQIGNYPCTSGTYSLKALYFSNPNIPGFFCQTSAFSNQSSPVGIICYGVGCMQNYALSLSYCVVNQSFTDDATVDYFNLYYPTIQDCITYCRAFATPQRTCLLASDVYILDSPLIFSNFGQNLADNFVLAAYDTSQPLPIIVGNSHSITLSPYLQSFQNPPTSSYWLTITAIIFFNPANFPNSVFPGSSPSLCMLCVQSQSQNNLQTLTVTSSTFYSILPFYLNNESAVSIIPGVTGYSQDPSTWMAFLANLQGNPSFAYQPSIQGPSTSRIIDVTTASGITIENSQFFGSIVGGIRSISQTGTATNIVK